VPPKWPENFHQAAAEALTTKELGATIGAGGYKPLKHRCAFCATRRIVSAVSYQLSARSLKADG